MGEQKRTQLAFLYIPTTRTMNLPPALSLSLSLSLSLESINPQTTMNSISNPKQCVIERRQTRMLKEFLKDDDSSSNSCSSSDPNKPPPPVSLQRSRSRSSASVSSFQKLLTSAVKSLHRISPSYLSSQPATLQRSLSKRLLTKFRRSKKSAGEEGKVMKVKDILRWRSFRDEENESRPSDFPATFAVATTTCCEESDYSFTADELPRRCEKGKKWTEDEDEVDVDSDDADGGDLVWETTGAMDVPEMGQGPAEDNVEHEEEDKEQQSPVSVLNSPFRDETSDEEVATSIDQSLANVERTKLRLLQSIRWLENLAGVNGQSTLDDDSETEEEDEEKYREAEQRGENTIEAESRSYMFKVLGRLTREGQGFKSKECVKDMERDGQWSKYEEERGELGVELETCLLHDLVDEVLVDLFG